MLREWLRLRRARQETAKFYWAAVERRKLYDYWQHMGRGMVPPTPIKPGEPARWA